MENLLYICVIPLALLLDNVLGELPTRYHPVAIMGTWAIKVEAYTRALLPKVEVYMRPFLGRILASPLATLWASRKKNNNSENNDEIVSEKTELNSEKTKLENEDKWILRIAGFCAAFCVVTPFVLIALLILASFSVARFSVEAQAFLAFLMTSLCLYLCIAPRSLKEHALAVSDSLEKNDVEGARTAVSAIVGRSTQNMDSFAVSRACIESVAENVTDSVLSSIFWTSVGLIFFGFEGAVAFMVLHRCFNTLDAMWGKRNETYQYFGTFAARMDDVLNFCPARLSLLSIVGASYFTPNTDYKEAWRVGYAYRYAHNSPNSAWSEAPFAGALGLKLGGPVSYGDLFVDYPYFGDGTIEADVSHIRLAIKLMRNCVLVFSVVSVLAVYLF